MILSERVRKELGSFLKKCQPIEIRANLASHPNGMVENSTTSRCVYAFQGNISDRRDQNVLAVGKTDVRHASTKKGLVYQDHPTINGSSPYRYERKRVLSENCAAL